MHYAGRKTSVGVIANPYSSRDIRRLVSSAASIQTVERANIVERIVISLGTLGVDKIVMMPDKSGISAHLLRNLRSHRRSDPPMIPKVDFLDIPITGTATDSEVAARLMRERKVDAVVILGGDGTHRIVAKKIGDIPLASISTGTNNAFPRFHEATLVGMAVGLYVTGMVSADKVLNRNKALHVSINGEERDIALVDVAITNDQWIGAKALWHTQNLKELYLAFCEPAAIGMSAIGGLFHPVSRHAPHGLQIMISDPDECELSVKTPIAPGLFEDIGIKSSRIIEIGCSHTIESTNGVIALDGEREIEFSSKDVVAVQVRNDGPTTIDIDVAIDHAGNAGSFVKANKKETQYEWG